jgi:hypothetical protein
MAQVIVNLCDAHLANNEDARVPGETVTVYIDGQGGDLDLCYECHKEYVDALEKLLVVARSEPDVSVRPKRGRPVKNTGDALHLCKVATCQYSTPSTTEGVWKTHYRRIHNTEYSAIKKYGIYEALSGKGVKWVCKMCEANPKMAPNAQYPRFWRTQGMMIHLQQTHGLETATARQTMADMEV